jgi:UDP-N-acetylmuramate dehydrogenase
MRGSYYKRRQTPWNLPLERGEFLVDWDPLRELLKDRLRQGEALSLHTSFRIGGPADALALVENLAELKECLDFAEEWSLPVFFLAGGTNVLVRDGGWRGLVVKLEGEFRGVSIDGARVRAGAGIRLARLASLAAEAGLAGLEFASGIPGTLGKGLVMNAGAHGSELSQVVRRVGYLEDGEVRECPAGEAGFGYRVSRFRKTGELLLWAEMELRAGDSHEIQTRMSALQAQRLQTSPLSLPNAGCAFKNPPEGPAGLLIEACGLKGAKAGQAHVSTLHANYIVNSGGARARDVIALMEMVKKKVLQDTGVSLEPEILIVGMDE